MDYRTTYRSFINSYYLSEGIRITVGLTLPSIIGTYLHHENIGITVSIGAICVTLVDNAGPVQHRKNAMLVCNAMIFIVSLLTGFAAGSVWVTGILIAVFCFIFSMIGVYGPRAGSVGLAALFVMVLNLNERTNSWAIILNALYILSGGIWYMLLSLSLYSFRPYKVTQQALGDLIQSTSSYMLWRTAFYAKDPDYDNIYKNLLDLQVEINDKQNLVRELLFKSRDVVKESTNVGRVTLLIFLDINDLFERAMSSQLDHRLLHQNFDDTGILDEFKNMLLLVSEELNQIGISVKSGNPYPANQKLEQALTKLKKDYEELRDRQRTASNVEGFIEIRSLLSAIEEFVLRLQSIQQYNTSDLQHAKQASRIQSYDDFVTHRDIDAKVFLDNFNWKSNMFRHALRVAMATTLGFIISEFYPVGHGYWILLTIIVILKPAYSITKKRNRDRLLGTILGAGIGVLIIYLVNDRQVMVGCMIALMVLAYSFMRTRYLIFTTLMTSYILILFYMLNPLHFRSLIMDRILDTAIGSGVALLANILLSPDWAYKQFADFLQQMLEANRNYFRDVTFFFTGAAANVNQYKLSRKEAYVALANISDALNRMLAEPKSKQKNAAEFHQLVVLNYMLSSHIATLASYAFDKNPPPPDPDYLPVVQAVISNLNQVINGISKGRTGTLSLQDKSSLPVAGEAEKLEEESMDRLINPTPDKQKIKTEGLLAEEGLMHLNARVTEMVTFRKKELEQGIMESHLRTSLTVVKSVNDQFNFIWKISEDLLKMLSGKLPITS
jgi:uncharacterized membrane protein (TIGR01666 family)